MLAWEHALGAWFRLSACRDEGGAGTVEVTCSVAHGNTLLDHTGTAAGGRIAFRVAGGEIVAFSDRRSTSEFFEIYAVKWIPWVERDHPDDALGLFTDDGYPVLTEESGRRHAGYVEEWAEAWGLG
jgi:hypothetical protein